MECFDPHVKWFSSSNRTHGEFWLAAAAAVCCSVFVVVVWPPLMLQLH
jgi:hypothetical protein